MGNLDHRALRVSQDLVVTQDLLDQLDKLVLSVNLAFKDSPVQREQLVRQDSVVELVQLDFLVHKGQWVHRVQ